MTNTLLTLLSTERLKSHAKDGFWADDTIYALAARHAVSAPQHPALRDRFRRVNYRDLLLAADRLAADLARNGVRRGQRVAVWLPSRIETAVALLACSRNGYLCCPSLHRDHTTGEILDLMERTRARALIAQPGYGADAERNDIFASPKLEGLAAVYALPPLSAAMAEQLPFADLPLADESAPEPTHDPNRPMYLAFTSGTSGQPKGVLHSDNTLLASVRAVAQDWQLDADTVIYTLSPLSHNLGMGALIAALAIGGELVVHDLPRGQSLLDRIVDTGTSYLIGVPTHAIDLLTEMRERGFTALGRVKGFRISGAAAPREVVAELLRLGVVPQSGYGMTETCSHQYTLPTDDPRLIVESCGHACAGYEVRIFRQDNPDIEAPTGEIGQIAGRGASLMLGYFNDQIATEESFNKDGWFLTGDLGWMDENGYLRITGRKKDVIIRGGHNIYPAKIEDLAMRHPALERVAAIAVPDARLGEKVCLVVAPRKGKAVSGAEILAHLDDVGLSRFDMPEYFAAVSEIPLTSSGKILKRELVVWLADGRLKPEPVRWQKQGA